MLNSADAVLRVTGMERTPQNAVIAGRWCIATFASVAVAAFSILAFRLGGRVASICVGGLLMTHPLVFELAHFFKEDPALMFGLALSFLAMQVFWEKRTTPNAALLGVACALAISGKYVGIAALLMAIILLIMTRKDGAQGARWFAFLGAFVGTLSVVNYQLVLQVSQFFTGFQTEMADLSREDKIHEIPRIAQTWNALKETIPLAFAFLIVAQIIHHLRSYRHEPVRWFLFLYPIIFVNILVWSPRLFTRHFLPIVTFACVLAGLAIPVVIGAILKKTRLPKALLLPLSLAVLALVYQQGSRKKLIQHYKAFENPTRETLIAKITSEIPEDAVIASDARVYLVDRNGNPREKQPVSQRVIVRTRLSEFGSVEALREMGVTHVAAHSIDSRALFDKDRKKKEPKDGQADEEAIQKGKRNPAFYRELKEHTKLLWHYNGKGNSYITPGLKFYELSKE